MTDDFLTIVIVIVLWVLVGNVLLRLHTRDGREYQQQFNKAFEERRPDGDGN